MDFLIPAEGCAVQAAYTVTNEETLQREVSALLKLDSIYPLRQMVIVTADEERTLHLNNGKTIEILPAWKWLTE